MRHWKSTLRELMSNNDENDKKAVGLDWQNNNFVNFFVVIPQPSHEIKTALFYVLKRM